MKLVTLFNAHSKRLAYNYHKDKKKLYGSLDTVSEAEDETSMLTLKSIEHSSNLNCPSILVSFETYQEGCDHSTDVCSYQVDIAEGCRLWFHN